MLGYNSFMGINAWCSKCRAENDRPRQRYCRACHAANMRKWRPAYKNLSTEEKRKSNCRAYANTYQRRGKLHPIPCATCGQPAQKHHPDYDRPLHVHWLCRKHHLALHRERALNPAQD
jgi:cytochrome c551/c552